MRRRVFVAGGASWALVAQDWSHSAAFQHLYNLDYDQAIQLLQKDCATQPLEPDHHNNLAYAILYRTLFNASALDGGIALGVADFLQRPKVNMSEEDRKHFHAAIWNAEEAARKRGVQANSLYALGVSHTHKANLSALVDKEWLGALKQGGEARKLHVRALELDKNFVDAKLVPSFHEYILGSMPIYLKAVASVAGLSGSREKGLNGIRTVAKFGFRAKLEAQVLLALIENREGRPEAAVEIMVRLQQDFPANHLYRMEVVSLLAASKRKEEAKREFTELADRRYRFLKPARLEAYRRELEAKLKA